MCYKTQGHYKSSDLSRILNTHFGKSMNLVRIKVMSMMICALCKVQQVAYTKLAAAFDNEERIELVNRFLRIADHDSIGHLMADREFVGSEWLEYLNAMGIHYHIRIWENFNVVRHGQGS